MTKPKQKYETHSSGACWGKSRRFGEDKLLFEINGKPLILHTIDRLEKCNLIKRVVIVASSHNEKVMREFGYEVIVDELEIGPISGLYSALSLGKSLSSVGICHP